MMRRKLDDIEKADVIKQAGRELGELVAHKNSQYGNSWEVVTELLMVLYPEGISIDSYQDIMLVVRICDKLCRISQGAGETEEPWTDLAGYGLLGSLQGKKEWA